MRKLFLSALLLACALPLAAQSPQPADQREELMRSLLDTFIGANDLAGALETAKKAEALYPESAFWVKKRGELSLWSSDPKGALQAFKKLLSFENTPELRRRVALLAIGLKDYETALYALELELAANNLEKADDLIYIYEQLGRPEKAAELIAKYSFRFNSPAGYSKAVELLTNMGERQAAEERYKTSIARFGLSTGTAQGYAELLASRRDLGAALAVLRRAEAKAGPADTAFWNMYGDLAWHFGDVPAAVKAAGILDAAGKAQEPEYDRLTAYYRAQGRREEAERAYAKAWRKTAKPYFLLAWLNAMAARGDYAAVGEAMEELTPEQERLAGASQYYWSLKALGRAAAGDKTGALRAYDSALALNPASEDLKIQLLWFLSSNRMGARLKERLAPLSAGGEELPEKQLALSYAYLAADDSASALSRIAGYRRLKPSEDSLGLAADAEEAAGDQGKAESLRFGRWLRLAKVRSEGAFASEEDASSWLGLCAAFCAAPRFSRELDLLSAVLPRQAVVSARLARASLQGEQEAAFRLARLLPERPGWARLSEALTRGDSAELSRLLGADPYSLPYRDRINALERLGLLDEARAETAALLRANGNDLFLNLKAARLLDPARTSAGASVMYRKRRAVETSGATASFRTPAGERLAISAGAAAYRRVAAGGGPLLLAKKHDDEGWAGFSWNGTRWDAALKAGGRDAARKFFTAGLEASRALRKGFKADFSAGYGARADESLNLETAGLKDFFSAYLSGPLARPYYFRAGAEASQFQSQDRVYAGRLNSLRSEISRQDRLPGWSLVSRLSYQNAAAAEAPGPKGSLDGSSPFEETKFLPGSFNQYGAGFALTRDGYRLPLRRLSPYLSADYYYNSSFLGGFGARAGASCSPWGRNILEVWLEYSKGYKGSGDEIKAAGASLSAYF